MLMQFREENGRKRKREGTENRNTNEKEGGGIKKNTTQFVHSKEREVKRVHKGYRYHGK